MIVSRYLFTFAATRFPRGEEEEEEEEKNVSLELLGFSIKENGMSGTQRPLKLSMFWNHCCEWIGSGVCEEQRKKCAGHDE